MSNHFFNYFRNISPEEWTDHTIEALVVIVQLLLLTLLFFLTKWFINRIFSKRITKRLRFSPSATNIARMQTISVLVKNAITYFLYFVYFYYVLTILGIPIGTLLAGAGVAGIAIGLGAQQLIKDIINGFFIILENQFEVGNWVELKDINVSGEVMEVGIRTTTIRAASGEIFYVPNSEILTINNQSRNQRTVNIDIPVHDKANIHELESVVEQVSNQNMNKFSDLLTDEPSIIGFVRGMDQSFNYRIAYTVKNGEQYKLEAQLYRSYLVAFQDKGIKIPLSVYDES